MKRRPDPGRSSGQADTKAVAFGSIAGFFAFGFGSGLSPWAPGTVGTLVAIPFTLILKSLDPVIYWAALVLLFSIGVRLCTIASDRAGTHDHGGIVWDEMVGYWLSVAFVPLQWAWLLAAFVLFRFFDILKPWPIRLVDNKVGGGLGIMLDDIMAAFYTVIVLAVVRSFL